MKTRRICRTKRISRESMIEHLATHKPELLAEEVLFAQEWAASAQRVAAMAERCGKVGYRTEQSATRVLLDIWERFGANDPVRRELRVYQCHHCEGRWHLTSSPLREPAVSRSGPPPEGDH